MPAAGRSNGDRQIALCLLPRTWGIRKFQQINQPCQQLAGSPVVFHELDDHPIAAGLRAQPGHEMRVREKTHVEREIGVHWDAVFEAEAHDGDR